MFMKIIAQGQKYYKKNAVPLSNFSLKRTAFNVKCIFTRRRISPTDNSFYLYNSTSFCRCSNLALAACSLRSKRTFARSGNLRVRAL